jgi:hypothetical protein
MFDGGTNPAIWRGHWLSTPTIILGQGLSFIRLVNKLPKKLEGFIQKMGKSIRKNFEWPINY